MNKVAITLFSLLLLLALFAGIYWFVPMPNESDFINEFSESLTNELSIADSEAATLVSADSTDELWMNVTHSFFLVVNNRVKAWSENNYVPDIQLFQDDFEIRFIQNNKGSFLVKKWKKKENFFLLLVLPLQFQYGIINNYLNATTSVLIPSNCQIASENSPQGACLNFNGNKCLLKIIKNKNEFIQDSTKVRLLIFCGLAILLVTLFLVNQLIYLKASKWKYEVLFFTNIFLLLSGRIVMVKFNIPRAYISSILFDPSHYASSSFNVSIADLLINSIIVLLLGLFLFFNLKRFGFIKWIYRVSSFTAYIVASFFVFAIYLSFLFPYLYIESIYHNSAISLEITDTLSFDSFRASAFFSLLIGCVCAYLIIRILIRLTLFTKAHRDFNFLVTYILGTLSFILFFLLGEKDYWIVLGVGFVFLPIIYFSKIAHRNQGFGFPTYVFMLVMIITFSLECALSALKFNQEKKTESQFKFGNNYLVNQDFLAEFLLYESSNSISKDEEIIKSIGLPNQEYLLKERVTKYYLTSYFDRYEITVTSFPNDTISAYFDEVSSLKVDQNRTSFDEIFFVSDPASDTLKRYVAFILINTKNEQEKVTIVIDLSLKKIIPETVFPELMIDNRYGQDFRNQDFSYALLTNGTLSSTFGDFNYEKLYKNKWLGQVELYNEGLIENGYRHVAIEYQPHRIAIITTPIYPVEYIVINFSFYIAIGLIVILVLLIITSLSSWLKGTRLGYASRIQLYVYLAFFIPLLIVSLVTLRLIIISAENQKEAEYLSKAKILEERISPILDNYKNQGAIYKGQLEAKLIEMAEVANLDASVFTKTGVVIASSEPLIFEDQLLSGIINRSAWHALIVNHENYSVRSESIGTLFYNCVYWAVKSPISGEVTAILSIPFFESASSLERTEINVVSSILGVFSIAFILFSLLSYFAINGLTAPLKFITNALRKISLSGKNVPINWKGNDELGILAQEYNKMLVNLEASKVELQKSQKEIVWREVAQQVAHEIKNPLTPMKLSLQQLELGLLKNNVDKEKSKHSIHIVLQQIDILNDIASSFSNFATMPSLNIKTLNVSDLLFRTIGLYTDLSYVTFNVNVKNNIFVICDESILLRAFSNIILNGIQAVSPNRNMEITVTIKKNLNDCIVYIKDNGNGIGDDVKDSVFRPHFTTKPTGSGLGLAIVKQTLELCNGSIWFETEVGVGTTFCIQLPLSEN